MCTRKSINLFLNHYYEFQVCYATLTKARKFQSFQWFSYINRKIHAQQNVKCEVALGRKLNFSLIFLLSILSSLLISRINREDHTGCSKNVFSKIFRLTNQCKFAKNMFLEFLCNIWKHNIFMKCQNIYDEHIQNYFLIFDSLRTHSITV